MTFVEGIVWSQASQMCCDTPYSFGKDIPRLNPLFNFRGGGGEGVGVDAKKYIRRGSSSE